MLKINRNTTSLERLNKKTLAQAEILERQGLQKMIVENPGPFFEEIEEQLILIGQEIHPSENVGDRIDILALDESGNTVIIELKRAENRFQLLQAISYAAMIADWSAEDFVKKRSAFANESNQESVDAIRDHLSNPNEEITINGIQRIILIAENFDFALLKSAEWLVEAYGVDIRCLRIEFVQDQAAEYISCVCVYPPVNFLASAARVRKDKIPSGAYDPQNWQELTDRLKNPDLKNFFRKETAGGEKSLGRRSISFRISGLRRISVSARSKHAYVWQSGRFDGDEAFWRERISEPESVREVHEKRSLSMTLTKAADFDALEAAIGLLEGKQFREPTIPADSQAQ